ncbi:MAG TPA: hypothetical protein VGD67_07310 [Pseudonocardiaceae bacterium]
MMLRRFLAVAGALLSLALSGTAVAAADGGRATASPVPAYGALAADSGPGVQTCLNAGVGTHIELKSCNWQVYVKLRGSTCYYGHFKIWNQWNTAQYRNSGDASHCASYGWGDMGDPWSNNTCGVFYRKVSTGWQQLGDVVCNHDA